MRLGDDERDARLAKMIGEAVAKALSEWEDRKGFGRVLVGRNLRAKVAREADPFAAFAARWFANVTDADPYRRNMIESLRAWFGHWREALAHIRDGTGEGSEVARRALEAKP